MYFIEQLNEYRQFCYATYSKVFLQS